MDVYIINLNRHAKRWQRIGAMLASSNLTYHRVAAVDARRLPLHWDLTGNIFDDPYPISRGDIACVMSHRKVWRQFLRNPAPWCAVLEDDACLSDDFADLLRKDNFTGLGFDVIKLETWWMKVLVDRIADARVVGRRVATLRSRHWGTAGYVVSREGARRLLRSTRRRLPADWLLFDPTVRDRRISVGQLIPGAVIQLHRAHDAPEAFVDEETRTKLVTQTTTGDFASISAADARRRRKRKRRAFKRLGHEIGRPFHQLRRLQMLLWLRMSGAIPEWTFVRFK